jgi:hypothetical protein
MGNNQTNDSASKAPLADNAMDPVTAQAHAQAGDQAGQPLAHRKEDGTSNKAPISGSTDKKRVNPVNASLADKLSAFADELNKSQHSEHDVGRANALTLVQRAIQQLNADPNAHQTGTPQASTGQVPAL